MSIEAMKAEIYRKYNNSDKWITKVRAMSDEQVIAIFMRIKRDRR